MDKLGRCGCWEVIESDMRFPRSFLGETSSLLAVPWFARLTAMQTLSLDDAVSFDNAHLLMGIP